MPGATADPQRRERFTRWLRRRLERERDEAAAVALSNGRRALTRLVERRSGKAGLPPGTLQAGEGPFEAARITAIRYDAEHLDELDGCDAPTLRALAQDARTTWIDLVGVHDVEAVRALGEAFGVHPLALEDVAHTVQRPKLEVYGDQLFVVARMVQANGEPVERTYCRAREGHTIEQVAFVAGPGYVLSFQERDGDVFDSLRDRLRHGSGRIRAEGADYLLYALLDVIVDHYFETLERIGDATEVFEGSIMAAPSPELQRALSHLRRDVVVLRRSVWPLREVLAGLLRAETPLVTERTRLYLRDAYDHLVQAVDILESLREVLGGLMDLYLSSLSTRMNEVMKVLTVIGSVFIPLTFLTGLYGMNFDNMPELHTEHGYFVFLGALVVIALGTLTYFKRKGWF